MLVRPIIVTVPKATVAEAITSDTWDGSIHSVDIPALEGSTLDYMLDQIVIKSEDEPTSWAIAFYGTSGADDADLDVDTASIIEIVTNNGAAASPQSGVGYYSNSDIGAYIRASAGTKTQPWDQAKHQIHFELSPQTGAKTAGATGEMTITLWLIPLTR